MLEWLQDGSPSLELLLQLLEVLIATEPLAAALAAKAADEADLKIIAEKFDRLVEASTENDWPHAEVEFHGAILHASKNPFFIQLQGAVDAAFTLYIPYTTVPSEVALRVPAHHAVLRALQRRKAQAAGAAMIDLFAEIVTLIADFESTLQRKSFAAVSDAFACVPWREERATSPEDLSSGCDHEARLVKDAPEPLSPAS